jgi:hypothetical protein
MAKKTVDFIRRTGTATSPIRQIICVNGRGKAAVEKTLSTPIEKVELPHPQFRAMGAGSSPIEQYAFRIGNKTVSRFADACALVLKRHHIEVADAEEDGQQAYVRKALRKIRGQEPIDFIAAGGDVTPARLKA